MLTKSTMEVSMNANQSFSKIIWRSKYLQKQQMKRLHYLKLCTNPPYFSMLMVHLTWETITKLILCKCSIHQINSFQRKLVISQTIWNKSRWSLRLYLITKFPRIPSLLGSQGITEILYRLPYLTRTRQLASVKKRLTSILTSWEIT